MRPRHLTVSRRLAHLLRVERQLEARGSYLIRTDIGGLESLRLDYDPLALRAACVASGFRLERRSCVIGGVARPYLFHKRAA